MGKGERAQHKLLVVCRAEAVWRRLELLAQLYAISRVDEQNGALAALREQHVDLALISAADLGAERCRQLTASMRELDPRVPIFVLTPSAWPEGEAAATRTIETFPQATLANEAGRGALVVAVERAISSRRQERAELYSHRGRRRAAEAAKGALVGESEAAQRLRGEIEVAASSELNLLITGETGVGKSMVADAVHSIGKGSSRPLVVVEPTSLPSSLFESELFGHVRGAFTGAASTEIGAFEAADGGTLFLDEIGDLPAALQIKLLRAVEAKVIRRLGDTREIHLGVRVITATNRELEDQVAAGAFRADLFHRLNEMRIHIPPLRERRDDVVPLLQRFLANQRELSTPPVSIAADAARLLREHAWPGNVRELRTLARRLADRELPATITEAVLVPIFPARVDRGADSDGSPEERIYIFRRRVYLEELGKNGFDIRATARALDLPYATLRSRLSTLDLLETIKERRSAVERAEV